MKPRSVLCVTHTLIAALLCGAVLPCVSAEPATAAPASFESLSKRANAAPEDLAAGNELRRWCRERKAVDRCVKFFDELVAAHPGSSAARYNAALAYIDNLPGRSILTQAKLSTQSITHASAIADRRPDDWLALYIRGLNNLYWPKWYRRAGRTAVDMQHLIDLTEALPEVARRPYMSMAYVALGDAYALLEQPKDARLAWKRGVVLFPSGELQSRLSIPEENIEREVEALRSRERPVDTDISFYANASSGSAQ